jgi:hypothetical protein
MTAALLRRLENLEEKNADVKRYEPSCTLLSVAALHSARQGTTR